jgi:hypothetical protein
LGKHDPWRMVIHFAVGLWLHSQLGQVHQ